jgi:hypothetical protein
MGIMGRSGSQVVCSSVRAPGFTGHFYGHVDHHFDYRKGYHGSFPARGEHPAERRAEFHGKAMHDPHGHEAPRGHK